MHSSELKTRRTHLRPRTTAVSRLAAVTVLAFLLGTSAFVPATGSEVSSAPRQDHVVLIDIDGLDPAYIEQFDTPNIDLLARRGNLSIGEGSFKTYSNSVRASTSTGAYPEVHGNIGFYYDRDLDRVVSQNRFLAAETIAQTIAAEGLTMASVQWYIVQNFGVTFGDPEHLYVQPGGRCDARVDAAIDILNLEPVNSGGQPVTVPRIPDLLTVYCDDPDALGHAEGPDSPNMPGVVAEVDRQIGRLVQATREVGIFGRTTFVLVSDHGMREWSQPLLPEFLEALESTGFTVQRVPTGGTAAPDTEVIVVAAPRTADIVLRGAADTDEGRQLVADAARSVDHVIVYEPEDLVAMRAGDKVGDFVVEPVAPWHLSSLQDGVVRGSHGGLDEIHVPVLIAGAGIRPGVAPTDPELVDVAPTISTLLGIRAPADAQGRVLEEVLVPPLQRAGRQ